GDRVSILAAMNISGFIAWESTPGTFDRNRFREAFRKNVAPLLNHYPLPRSIVILDIAKIHMYRELEELIHSTGALLFFLPPHSSPLNPNEVGFGLLNKALVDASCAPCFSF
ncbi:Transposase, partial [Phytophthora megakarya]